MNPYQSLCVEHDPRFTMPRRAYAPNRLDILNGFILSMNGINFLIGCQWCVRKRMRWPVATAATPRVAIRGGSACRPRAYTIRHLRNPTRVQNF